MPGVASNHVSSNALFADSTARSTSVAEPSWTSARTSPVAGLVIERV
jgi:hypothetical protein